MKKSIFYWMLASMICVVVSCADKSSTLDNNDGTRHDKEEPGDTGMWESPYFITEYLEVSKISVGSNASNHFYLAVDGEVHQLDPLTDNITEEAKYFAELYGDTQYNQAVHPGQHSAAAYPIDKITISCEQDFDAEHPAGEPLDDIVKLDYLTYYDFVKSGYQPNKEYRNSNAKLCSHYFKDVAADNTLLMGVSLSAKSIATIKFDSKPEIAGNYTFTLSAQINGEVMTTTFTTTFE